MTIFESKLNCGQRDIVHVNGGGRKTAALPARTAPVHDEGPENALHAFQATASERLGST